MNGSAGYIGRRCVTKQSAGRRREPNSIDGAGPN